MNLRAYQSDDVAAIACLFTESVKATCLNDYSAEQIAAWAPDPPDLDEWRKRLETRTVLLAELGSFLAGFLTFESSGHLDHLYVHSRFQRRGVASALYRDVEDKASALAIERIYTEASITGRPFFASLGFDVIASQFVICGDHSLMNFRMEKFLR